jgi:hypothetical protein
MRRYVTFLLVLIIVALFVSTAVSGELSEKDKINDSQMSATNDYHLVDLIGDLSEHKSFWVEAHMVGDRQKLEDEEAVLLALLNYDLGNTAHRVSNLAKAVLLAYSSEENDKSHQADSLSNSQRDAFQYYLSLLNSKERVYKTISSTKDFSVKYRMFDDYLDILQKEVQLVQTLTPGSEFKYTLSSEEK